MLKTPGPQHPDIGKIRELQQTFKQAQVWVTQAINEAWQLCSGDTICNTNLDSEAIIGIFCAASMNPKLYVAKYFAERRREKDPLVNYLLGRIEQASNKMLDLSEDPSAIPAMAYHLCSWAEFSQELIRLHARGWAPGEDSGLQNSTHIEKHKVPASVEITVPKD